MIYRIRHVTKLAFPSPAREHHGELRLMPRQDATQLVRDAKIELAPAARLHFHVDAFGNHVHHFVVVEPHELLTITLAAEVETRTAARPKTEVTAPRERAWLEGELRAEPRLWAYLAHRSAMTPALDGLADGLELPRRDPEQPLRASLDATLAWIAATFAYRPGATEVHSPLADVLEAKAGVCQDFAHLLIALARSWGVPARYVMGYLDPAATTSGVVATHAWTEILVPGQGWVGLDPTHQRPADERYVAVAIGRDSRDVAPQRGSYRGDGAGKTPEIELTVDRPQ